MSGFGTAEELMFLEHEGMKYHPDVVVLAFFENDFDDNVVADLYELENGKLVVKKTSYTPGVEAIAIMNAVPGAFWLSQHSYLYARFLNAVWATTKEAFRIIARKKVVTEYAIKTSEVGKYEEELAVALLERIKAVVHTAKIPFIIVEIPSPSIAQKDKLLAWLPSVPHDLIPAIISSCDIYVPASSYLASAQKGTVHLPHGHRHISEETHARIAEVLDRILSERLSLSTGIAYPEK